MSDMHPQKLSRRSFLQVSAGFGGALVVGLYLPGCARHSLQRREMAEHAERTGEFIPNAWIKITRGNDIIYTLDRVEMGQGTMTSHAMMVAEELEVELEAIKVEWARADRKYDNSTLSFQVTGGSTSVVSSWEPLRKAAATTREMLRRAAAAQWEVKLSECEARMGEIIHKPSSRRYKYGELTEIAALIEPQEVKLKSPKEFRLIGKPADRLDARMKVDGSGIYGMDVVVPGMVSAVIIRSPVPGGTPRSFRADKALSHKGVRYVFAISRGIAVVADTYWQARTAAAAVAVEWDEGKLSGFDTETLRKELALRAGAPAKEVRSEGDAKQTLGKGAKTIEAVYEVPYLAHATMEPMNCTAYVSDEGCEIWCPTQAPGIARQLASVVTGLDQRDIVIHNTLLGGGFGRRLAQDFVVEAVEVSMQIKKPVKVVWSREDDMQTDYYRPQTYNVLKGTVSSEGEPVAWFHRIAAPSILSQAGQDWLSSMMPSWIPQVAKVMLSGSASQMFKKNVITDQTSVEGAATLPYTIKNLQVEYADHDPGVPLGFWRSVGHSENAFVVESFMDELAHAAGKDPFEFRRSLLKKTPRNLRVLELAAEKAGWGTATAAGVYRGIAQHESFGSFCAEVAEVSVAEGQVRVHRVVCAIDCGLVVNPDIVKAQMESSIVFGLSAALKQQITFAGGKVEQSNFHDFPLLRMFEMPKVEVYIVASDKPPSGVGEPGLPPIAPAVANAIFAATGKRIRRLPIEPELAAAS